MQLIRAALKKANQQQLHAWASESPSLKLPEIASTQVFSAAEFQARLTTFNRLHDWRETYLHPCFAQFLGLPQIINALAHRHSPFPLMGLVHVGNLIDVIELVRNEDLRIDCHLGAIRPHARGVSVDIRMQVFQRDILCMTASSQYLYRITSDDTTERVSPTLPSLSIPADEVTSERNLLPFDEDVGRKYARLSGDFNPIHLFKLSAKLFGFKTHIAHGMHVLALALSRLHNNDSLFAQPATITNQFNHPVALPCLATLLRAEDDTDSQKSVAFELHDPKAARRKQMVLAGKIVRKQG
ncbi:MaoC/PaaZ C-terminal domain-containing protein [Alteromonas ponticola]|uniref:MaoC-like domain-containing protein n=1 Tax=Alteromonas ponticola TaxID=2720613 RepID=A0ABX1R5A2_9ALTE|nr:MaoC/PaaZ C-terminal domain-containing protein [Alteromonas ponticola]NMH60657.1 hypothetical protein [Alteromonas ponticola]